MRGKRVVSTGVLVCLCVSVCGVRGSNPADINNDGIVDMLDVAIVCDNWLWEAPDPCEFALIPGGTFQMGDTIGEGLSYERPAHTVTVGSFYMGRCEITNQQYCDFLNSANGQGLITVTSGVVYKTSSGTSYPYCDTSTSSSSSQIAYNGTTFSVRTKGGRSMVNDPMVRVSWYGAVAYCNWRSAQEGKGVCYDLSTWDCDFAKKGYRLATEAEWEYAARGGLSGSRFPWGNDIYHTQANYKSSSSNSYDKGPTGGFHPLWNDGVGPYTSPVGFFDGTMKQKVDCNWADSATSYQTTNGANGYGLYDMVGNVFEWCNNWFDSYSSDSQTNPTGPSSGTYRVPRGGVWSGYAYYCRVAYRGYLRPNTRDADLGFRVVLAGEVAKVVVPDVVGMAQPDAEAAVAAAALVVGTISEEFSDTVPEGCVISQTPLASQTVLWGSPVDLVVSTGPSGIVHEEVLIPGGTFEMGDSFSEGHSDELPVHTVTVDSFYMSKYEITNQQYCDYLNSALGEGLITVTSGVVYKAGSGPSYAYCGTWTTEIASEWYRSQILYNGSVFSVRAKGGRSMVNDPMVSVSWYGAAAYCNWRSQQLGKQLCYDSGTLLPIYPLRDGVRLATEAEWEYAARAGLSERRFPWGDTITHSQANYFSQSSYSYDTSPTRGYHPTWSDGVWPYTSPVGSFPANGYGLCDMAGNVFEWCNDWYGSYSSASQTNPTGPFSGTSRVWRGGGWDIGAYHCRAAFRYYYAPGDRYYLIGFRVVLDF